MRTVKLLLFTFLFTFMAQTELVETCRYVDRSKVAVVSYISTTFKRPVHEAVEIYEAAIYSSQKYNVALGTILAVIAVESSFNPLAESGSGGLGLMQVTVQSGKKYSKNIKENLDSGVGLLVEYTKRYGSLAHQIFNVGPTGYKKGRRAVEYDKKVTTYKAVFERILK